MLRALSKFSFLTSLKVRMYQSEYLIYYFNHGMIFGLTAKKAVLIKKI